MWQVTYYIHILKLTKYVFFRLIQNVELQDNSPKIFFFLNLNKNSYFKNH